MGKPKPRSVLYKIYLSSSLSLVRPVTRLEEKRGGLGFLEQPSRKRRGDGRNRGSEGGKWALVTWKPFLEKILGDTKLHMIRRYCISKFNFASFQKNIFFCDCSQDMCLQSIKKIESQIRKGCIIESQIRKGYIIESQIHTCL